MKSNILKYSLLLLVFLGSSLNLIHAHSAKSAIRTKADVLVTDWASLEDNSDKCAFNLSVIDRMEILYEDNLEEEKTEEELIRSLEIGGVDNYFNSVFSLSKIKFYNSKKCTVPILTVEPLERFSQKRYRFLQVFRI